MVNAAGNDVHSAQGKSINCPACIESGIAVANTTHGRYFGQTLQVSAKNYPVYPGDNHYSLASTEFRLASLNSIAPLADDGCTPFNSAIFEHALVMVDYRHMCTLEQVAQNVKSAGGGAVLVYQSGAFGMATIEPFVPLEGEYVIPVYGVSRETGLALFELAYTGKNIATLDATFKAHVEPQFVDMMHPFSSTGPNNNPAVLKPDLSAPGTHVLSALSPDIFSFGGLPLSTSRTSVKQDDVVFGLMTGTSMATPQAAGAVALLKQQHPDWSVGQIKSALTSTATDDIRLGVEKASPFWQGAGRINIDSALRAALGFEQVSFASGACIGGCSFSNKVSLNNTESVDSWSVNVKFENPLVEARLDGIDSFIKSEQIGQDGATFSLHADTSLATP
ncbi:S8 family serine peptidase [Neptunicella marina]|uniref:S8 family serine peptidase n=1 Tax=Neptunicella marina TaxID=2125989 RepID=A0A8J6IXD4_9ALTE|nr:S8 family serine peptidase [Neptunicella marina]MBC3767250.1 S8 family serine peptidase [Neptunicella marina]